LWGNGAKVLGIARAPQEVAKLLRTAGLAHPRVYLKSADVPNRGSWLVKPVAGSGGRAIHRWRGAAPGQRPRRVYFQEHVEGEPCAGLYLGDGQGAALLGATRQLVGEPWLHAAPFQYCGSIGPLHLEPAVWQRFEEVGTVLARGCGLRGLFGVDCILRDGVPWPVEVNPRYTASIEVLEYATGLPALARHCAVFEQASAKRGSAEAGLPQGARTSGSPCVGKAIVFARQTVTMPSDGPWSAVLEQPGSVHELPLFADIPSAGQRIKAGHPVLTCMARGDSPSSCLDALRQIARDIDLRLLGR
jgi:predicted ATP-grasp superfamily ATP-dependent carboligase